MATQLETTYQDPQAAGSLPGLLQLWLRFRTSNDDTASSHVTFTLSCWGETRANRVAGFLRRRRACGVMRVDQVPGAHRDVWRVHGSLRPAIQSLTDLEAVWMWLRGAACSHQVELLHIDLAPVAA